jgi:hypothetical protein
LTFFTFSTRVPLRFVLFLSKVRKMKKMNFENIPEPLQPFLDKSLKSLAAAARITRAGRGTHIRNCHHKKLVLLDRK